VSEKGFTSEQRNKVIYRRVKHGKGRNKSRIIGKKRGENRKVKRRVYAATLADLYPSTCLAWVSLSGV